MPSDISLFRLIQAMIDRTIEEAAHRPRVTRTLSGTVEAIDPNLDVAYIRLDNETMGTSVFESDNYEAPGLIAASRHGETYIDEQVRVMFEGSAGASAMRTGVGDMIILPYGADVGRRIVMDSTAGMRFWDEQDQIRMIMSSVDGIQVRDPESGIVGVAIRKDGIIVADPVTGETIAISSGTVSAMPAPHWTSAKVDAASGTSHSTPSATSFGTGDDLDLRFMSASAFANIASNSFTPPGSYTEQSDIHGAGTVSLATSVASRDPAAAAPGTAAFTSTSSAFTRRVGHSVIVRGGGPSPSVAEAVTNPIKTFSVKNITLDIDGPATPTDGDLIIAHVALAGPAIPVNWTTPEDWIPLGVNAAGVGTNHVLGSGIWYKRWATGDPTSETVIVNMSTTAQTKVQATVVRVADPYVFPAGLDIRRNNRSMPRGLERSITVTTTQGPYTTGSNNTALTLADVEFKAGRTYGLSLSVPRYILTFPGGGSAAGRWALDLHTDVEGRIARMGVASIGSLTSGQSARLSLANTFYYTPAADQIRDLTVVAAEDADGMNFSIEASSAEPASLTVVDLGATF